MGYSKPLLIFIVLLSFSIEIVFGRLREFEENCSPYKLTSACRSDLDLICDPEENICTCKPMSYYDEDVGACVALIGETCTPTENQNYYYNSYGGYGHGVTISRCPSSATCANKDPNRATSEYMSRFMDNYGYGGYHRQHEFKCYCKPGFYAKHDGSDCMEALKHGENCTESDNPNCDKGAGLFCGEQGVCECETSADEVHYDDNLGKCVTKIGMNCTHATTCEKNAICSVTLDKFRQHLKRNYGHHSPEHRAALEKDEGRDGKSSGVCSCLPGFTLNLETSSCVASYGVACSEDVQCNNAHFLSCVEGVCQCQAGAHQIFTGSENGTCHYLAASSCSSTSGPSCIENSECIHDRCVCAEGFSETPSGKCLPSYQAECTHPNLTNSNSPWTHTGMNESCNFYQGLACINRNCQCFDSNLIWDKERRLCVSKEHEHCGPFRFGEEGRSRSRFHYDPTELPYPFSHIYRHENMYSYGMMGTYYVACGSGLKCTKDYNGINGWNICTPKNEI